MAVGRIGNGYTFAAFLLLGALFGCGALDPAAPTQSASGADGGPIVEVRRELLALLRDPSIDVDARREVLELLGYDMSVWAKLDPKDASGPTFTMTVNEFGYAVVGAFALSFRVADPSQPGDDPPECDLPLTSARWGGTTFDARLRRIQAVVQGKSEYGMVRFDPHDSDLMDAIATKVARTRPAVDIDVGSYQSGWAFDPKVAATLGLDASSVLVLFEHYGFYARKTYDEKASPIYDVRWAPLFGLDPVLARNEAHADTLSVSTLSDPRAEAKRIAIRLKCNRMRQRNRSLDAIVTTALDARLRGTTEAVDVAHRLVATEIAFDPVVMSEDNTSTSLSFDVAASFQTLGDPPLDTSFFWQDVAYSRVRSTVAELLATYGPEFPSCMRDEPTWELTLGPAEP